MSPVTEAGLVGATVMLLVVLALAVAVLIQRYRSECAQLRARNTQLSIENDRWHDDFAVQTGELAALRRIGGAVLDVRRDDRTTQDRTTQVSVEAR